MDRTLFLFTVSTSKKQSASTTNTSRMSQPKDSLFWSFQCSPLNSPFSLSFFNNTPLVTDAILSPRSRHHLVTTRATPSWLHSATYHFDLQLSSAITPWRNNSLLTHLPMVTSTLTCTFWTSLSQRLLTWSVCAPFRKTLILTAESQRIPQVQYCSSLLLQYPLPFPLVLPSLNVLNLSFSIRVSLGPLTNLLQLQY